MPWILEQNAVFLAIHFLVSRPSCCNTTRFSLLMGSWTVANWWLTGSKNRGKSPQLENVNFTLARQVAVDKHAAAQRLYSRTNKVQTRGIKIKLHPLSYALFAL